MEGESSGVVAVVADGAGRVAVGGLQRRLECGADGRTTIEPDIFARENEHNIHSAEAKV